MLVTKVQGKADQDADIQKLVADMGLDRRTFLQQAGLALCTWGVTEAGLSSLGKYHNRLAILINRYQQSLADPTNRKLALLVGVNRYPHQEHLDGCLTDIELQKELLVYRFGFQPQNIITLSDRQATRENIETAFIEHLGQAQSDDVVVFHFSGYGGQIKMPLTTEVTEVDNLESTEYKLVDTLLPVDGIVSGKNSLIANGILQDTLLLLAQSLSTPKCTFILDTSFNLTPKAKHGNFKVRSLSQVADESSSQELLFLEQLRNNLASKGLKPSKRSLSLPGVVLSASSKNQIAVERQWNDFSAGLFTHALTQHLWQTSPSNKIQVVLAETAATVEQVMGKRQEPTINSPEKQAIAYYLACNDVSNATGIVSKVNQGNLEIKLLGLPANILNAYRVDSCLRLVTSTEDVSKLQIQIKSRNGLTAKAQFLDNAIAERDRFQTGAFLQESWRVLARNLGLTLGLDADLERIERVDATSAIANIATIDSTVVLGEQNADCLLGKVEHQDSKTEEQVFSYGLYTPGGILLGKTSGTVDEAVKIAIERLQPHFKNLLAIKWLELTKNQFSSGLKVNAAITSGADPAVLVLQKATYLADINSTPAKKTLFPSKNPTVTTPQNLPVLIKGANLQLTLNNLSDRQLYVLVFGIDIDSNLFALYTPMKSSSQEAEIQLTDITISPQVELSIPQTDNSWQWKVADSIGINTLYIVFAIQPFTQTLKALANQQNFKLDREEVLNVVNPTEVIKSLLKDLHAASSAPPDVTVSNDVYAWDVNSWATLDCVYEVSST